MDNLIYYDETNGLWVVNDLEGMPPGHVILKVNALTGFVSLALPGIDAPIKDADPATIYKDADKTETYTGLSDLKATCAGLFKRVILSTNVLLTDPTTQSPTGDVDKLSDSLAQIVSWLGTLQNIVDSLANATGLIAFSDFTATTTEQTCTFTVSSPSTDTGLLDFDATNSLINYVANAKFNVSSIMYVTNTDGLDHTLTISVYSVVSEVETLIDTFDKTIPKKSNALIVTNDYIETITDAPRDVRLKISSTHDTKITTTGFIMKIVATNPE